MSISKTVLLIFLSGSAITQRTLAHPAWLQDASDPNRASIDGIVEDEYGQPLADATVTATPPGPLSAILPETRTDTRGRFSFAGLHPGRTYVEACKEDAFYPCRRWSLWGTGSGLIEIELRAGTQVSGVLVSVSPAARLRVRAVNAATGATIDRISVRIERAGEPNRWIEGGKEIWLIPPSPVRVRVDAQGFASSWYSEKGREGQPSPILLAPRQDASVVVPLRPISPSPDSKFSTGPVTPGS